MSILVNGFIQNVGVLGTDPEGYDLYKVHLYFDVDQPDLDVSDMFMDIDKRAYMVVDVGQKTNPSQWREVIVKDVNKTGHAPASDRGSIFTPTYKWKMGRTGQTFPGDQLRGIIDDNYLRVIDENLGGDKLVTKLMPITQGNEDEGFIDISSLVPCPSSVIGFTVSMQGGIEQVNAAAGVGAVPDFELVLAPVNRLIFKNYGSPSRTLTDHWGAGDVLILTYTYKA